ncbi:MAG TPA: hypothetical protein VF573_17415 [Paraburkholderia sp.]|uniref:hypothetical protein n=1 Tax=Paraburkholderia sp. TaxID=1926495 RepID=UPI002ED0462E
MQPFSKQARALALEALLAHFPNPLLVALGVERVHGERLARALPGQLYRLRTELERELRQVSSASIGRGSRNTGERAKNAR